MFALDLGFKMLALDLGLRNNSPRLEYSPAVLSLAW